MLKAKNMLAVVMTSSIRFATCMSFVDHFFVNQMHTTKSMKLYTP